MNVFFQEHQSYCIRATPLLSDLICSDPVSKSGHILRYWGLGHKCVNFGGHNSTDSKQWALIISLFNWLEEKQLKELEAFELWTK